ncbi:MAG: DNA-binding protein WhiA [Erysipelotrichaceae bacterium]|nr:DNA-binding protein WhiA [Erysipelotrichaceae bacterium]
MSFTNDIKKEISFAELDACCAKSELSAIIQLTSSLTISNKQLRLVVRSENPTTVKRAVVLLKELYKVQTELTVAKKSNLKKNNIYIANVIADGREILTDLGLYTENRGLLSHPTYLIVSKNCCAKNYLAGCFLAYGACNSPANKNYHLEISLTDLDHANFVVKLMSRFNIEGKVSKRRNKYIVYLKKADSISDFLRILGANESLYEFEDSRISKDIKHSIVRMDNCEIANEMKSLKAAESQVAYMELIKKADKYNQLDEKLKNVIDIRLQHQDYSLNELCESYEKKYGESLSKSGLKHRLNKIESIAKSIQESDVE